MKAAMTMGGVGLWGGSVGGFVGGCFTIHYFIICHFVLPFLFFCYLVFLFSLQSD